MADDDKDSGDVSPKKSSRGSLAVGMVLLLVFGTGSFFAVSTGLLLDGGDGEKGKAQHDIQELQEAAFIPMDPLLISLSGEGRSKHLRFSAQIEVEPDSVTGVTNLLPRIVDVLNSYLRAVDVAELEKPASLIRLRGQMLRRIQLVTGDGHIRDLLIMEFVLN